MPRLRPLKRHCEKALRKFDRLPLAVRFLLAFTLPVIAVVWMSVFNGVELYRASQNIEQLEQHTNLAVDAGLLVGAIQRERGFSSIFIESRGALYHQPLQETRQATDQQLATLKAKLSQTEFKGSLSAFEKNLHNIAGALASLPDTRERIDSLAISGEDTRSYFTRHVDAFNEQISHLSAQTDLNHIGRKLNAYFILNRLKELLGQERVIISQALVSQQLTREQLHQLLFFSGRQLSAQIVFKTQTDPADGYQTLSIESEATNFRNQLLEAQDRAPVLRSITLENWFALQSDRIGAVKAVEARLTADILEETSTRRAHAQAELWRYIIISPLVLLGGLGLAYLIFRHIKSRLQLIETVFEHTHDRVTVTDSRARIIEVNAAFSNITGYSRREVLGKNSRMLQSGKQDKAFYQELWHKLKTDGTWQGEIWNRRKNGEIYAELATISAVKNRKGGTKYYVAVSSDITDRAFEHQQQLEFRAYHDPLTGLPNQLLIRDRLEHALSLSMREDKHIVVASLDIDNFKQINEQNGHNFGDSLLELIAKRLRATLRDCDSLARTGGDEFLMVLESIDELPQVKRILERIQKELAKPLTLSGTTVSIGTSIGATHFPENTGDADTLIRHATQALHEAKQNGRGRLTWFDPEKARNQTALSHLLKRLENAIANSELLLHFQPKVNMVTGDVLGFEALLRWHDPVRGLIPPGEFLPRIEQHPFSIVVGDWVIESAIAQIETWKALGISTSVSVNIGSLQLLAPSFIEKLKKQIQRHPGFDPGSLELEILESAAINDIQLAADVIEQCRELGVGSSLDDFGTGYAALEYLKRLPATSLKIDQTFVRDMLEDSGDKAIVKGIIGLANAFDFGVIAEGVETEEQGLALIRAGCVNAQGFGIGRPMPAELVEEWLSSWQPPVAWLTANGTQQAPLAANIR